MLRVLHTRIQPRDVWGGVERIILGLCRNARRSRMEVLLREDSEVSRYLDSRGVRVHLASKLGTSGSRWESLLRRFDCLHVHDPVWMGDAPCLDMGLAQASGVPHLVTVHGMWRLPALECPVVCVSPHVAALQPSGTNCLVVPNAVDTRRFNPRGRKAHRGIDVIRVCRKSRCDPYFWRAIERVLLRHRKMRVHIVGETGIDCDRVKYHGVRGDVARLLGGADIFAYAPIPTEGGQDVVVLEAMAMGLPAVVSDVACVRGSITHMHDGLLVPFGDVSAFADSLEQLVLDGKLRTRLGAEAIRTVRTRFSMNRMVSDYEGLYAKLVTDAT